MRRLAVALVAFAMLALAAIAVWEDAALEPGVASRLQIAPRLPQAVNLFYPLAGFGVAQGEDPAAAGYAATTRVNAVLAAAAGADSARAVEAAWVKPALDVADPDGVLCAPVDAGCIGNLVRHRDAVEALAERNRVLLGRYSSLAGFPAFQTEVTPDANAPMPAFRVFIAAHRLWLASLLIDHIDGDADAFDRIEADVHFLRRLLAIADSLLLKMVAASLLADSLHVFAAAMDGPDVEPAAIPKLARYSSRERSMELAFAGEFRVSVSMIATLDRQPQFYRDLGLPESVSPILVRPLFKPNRSVNLVWNCFERTLATIRRAREAASASSCEPRWTEWALNPIGAILASVAAPDLSRYAARLEDLGGLIALVNLKRAIRETGIDAAGVGDFVLGPGQHVTDPSTGKRMVWDAEGGTLGFDSANPEPRFNRLALTPLG